MASISEMALPGGIPMSGLGRGMITPESLFSSSAEKAAYQKLVDHANVGAPDVKIRCVKVKIFDLSDPKQVKAYEKLWTELLEKASKLEVVVESRKDLVQRENGTSYWMKYVEYVEFGDAQEEDRKSGKANRKDSK